MQRSDLSLVVMSRNRAHFLARLLDYYRSQRFTATILLSDASSGRMREEAAGIAATYRDSLDLAFTQYPDVMPPMERLAREMGKVDTPYVAWVGDDDFALPRALDLASAHLDAHAQCFAVTGKALQFIVQGDGAWGRVAALGDYMQVPCEQALAGARLAAEARQGIAYTYALRRTAIANENLARFDLGFWPDDPFGYYFFEIMDGLLGAISGRIAMLDDLMLLRQTHARASAMVSRETHKLYRVVLHPRWPEFNRKIVDTLAAALHAQQPELTQAQCIDCAELALCTRIGATLQKVTNQELLGSQPPTSGAVQAAKGLVRRVVPGVTRSKGLLVQRLKLRRDDRRELGHIVKLIEAGDRGQGSPTVEGGARA